MADLQFWCHESEKDRKHRENKCQRNDALFRAFLGLEDDALLRIFSLGFNHGSNGAQNNKSVSKPPTAPHITMNKAPGSSLRGKLPQQHGLLNFGECPLQCCSNTNLDERCKKGRDAASKQRKAKNQARQAAISQQKKRDKEREDDENPRSFFKYDSRHWLAMFGEIVAVSKRTAPFRWFIVMLADAFEMVCDGQYEVVRAHFIRLGMTDEQIAHIRRKTWRKHCMTHQPEPRLLTRRVWDVLMCARLMHDPESDDFCRQLALHCEERACVCASWVVVGQAGGGPLRGGRVVLHRSTDFALSAKFRGHRGLLSAPKSVRPGARAWSQCRVPHDPQRWL